MAKKEETLARFQSLRTLMSAGKVDGKAAVAFMFGEIEKVIRYLSDIPKGEKGDRGAKGDKGDRGPRGSQGLRGSMGLRGDRGAKGDKGDRGEQGVPGNTPQLGRDYFNGAKGDPGSADTGEDIIRKINKQKKEKIDASHIKNLPSIVETRALPNLSLFGGRGGGGRYIEVLKDNVSYGQDIRKIIFAGNGFSLTRLADGVVAVTATASGSANIDNKKVTGNQSGNDTIIDLSQLPNTPTSVLWVSYQGQVIDPTDPGDSSPWWSLSGIILTVHNASANGTFLVEYKYA